MINPKIQKAVEAVAGLDLTLEDLRSLISLLKVLHDAESLASAPLKSKYRT
jgi:hypothetical protein